MARISFTEHPASVDETYGEHFMVASSFGVTMIVAGFACLMHGIFPFLCNSTGSNAVTTLHKRMVTHRVGGEAPLLGADLALDGALER